jgi:hypothetical protein
MIFPAFSYSYNYVTSFFTIMSFPHQTPVNGAWSPLTPLFGPPCPHRLPGYGGMGVTSFYDFKKCMSQKPVFQRTRRPLTNYIHHHFARILPLRVACSLSSFGKIAEQIRGLGTQVATVRLCPQKSKGFLLAPPSGGAIVRLSPLKSIYVRMFLLLQICQGWAGRGLARRGRARRGEGLV